MDRDHALCSGCRNVVRTDWEHCFHCGRRDPVARPATSRILHTSLSFLGLAVIAIGASRATEIWQTVRSAPQALVHSTFVNRAAVERPRVSQASDAGPSSATFASPRFGAPQPETAARPALVSVTPSATPRTTTATSGGDVVRTPDGGAAHRLDEERTARLIAECESATALDSLEVDLREAYPDDPGLRVGGATWLRLKARRAALATR